MILLDTMNKEVKMGIMVWKINLNYVSTGSILTIFLPL